MGSSPLARGLRLNFPISHTSNRIIPARAGFTVRACVRRDSAEDHPRSRGVYVYGNSMVNKTIGSSPLARGLQNNENMGRQQHGIIPARAGFTRPDRTGNPGNQGSSPLARGLRKNPQDDAGSPGIIPARAGFTATSQTLTTSRRDHPRSRGVYIVWRFSRMLRAGSSPLARGLPRWPRVWTWGRRIIPARAGFTCAGASPGARRKDHPRSRGVYGTCRPGLTSVIGSSPLARGLRR